MSRACRRCQRLLPDYRLNALPPRPQRWLAAHLAGCTACRAELDLQVRLAAALHRTDPARLVPETETAAVASATALAARGLRALQPAPMAAGLRWAASALAAALLFGGGLAVGRAAFPQVRTEQVVQTVPVERVVTKVVEKRVEVPIDRIVERVVYQPVVRTRTVRVATASPGPRSTRRAPAGDSGAPALSAPVRVADVAVAATPPAANPGGVVATTVASSVEGVSFATSTAAAPRPSSVQF